MSAGTSRNDRTNTKTMRSNLKICLLLAGLALTAGCTKRSGITLVKNGKTDYAVYVDPSAPSTVKAAAEDLIGYFEKVTGASPELVVDAQLPEIPFISLGNLRIYLVGLALVQDPDRNYHNSYNKQNRA